VEEDGRVRGGNSRSPVGGMGGMLRSFLALLSISKVLVWLHTFRRRAQLMMGCGAWLCNEHVVG
jgi:hypothetical protein